MTFQANKNHEIMELVNQEEIDAYLLSKEKNRTYLAWWLINMIGEMKL